MENEKSQAEKFREAARQLETDDDESAFNEKLGKLVKPKPLTEDSTSEYMSTDGDDG